MRNLFLALVALTVLTASACRKSTNAEITRNCTGTYVKIKGKEFRVCNSELLESYSEGAVLEIKYKTIKDCDRNEVVCMMVYEYDKDIEITKIN